MGADPEYRVSARSVRFSRFHCGAVFRQPGEARWSSGVRIRGQLKMDDVRQESLTNSDGDDLLLRVVFIRRRLRLCPLGMIYRGAL